MIRKKRSAETAEEFALGAVPVKKIIWHHETIGAEPGERGIPSYGPVALLDITNHPQVNITDLVRVYQTDVQGGEGPTEYAWDFWPEPGNFLARLILAYTSPVQVEFFVVFNCSDPQHWSFLRWVAENEGMVALADEFAGPIPDEGSASPRPMLLVETAVAGALGDFLRHVSLTEAEQKKGQELTGIEMVMAALEAKRFISFEDIAAQATGILGMPVQGREQVVLETPQGQQIVSYADISLPFQALLQQVSEQENVGAVLLGGVPHIIRLDWLQEMGPRDLERTEQNMSASMGGHAEAGQRASIFSPLPLEEFTAGTIPVVRIVEPRGSSKGTSTANGRHVPIALLNLSGHPEVDLSALSRSGVFERGTATEFVWDLALRPDDILVRLTCIYHVPTSGQVAVLFSLLQHNAFLRWALEHDYLVPLAEANWMERQESSTPQVLLYAQDDGLAVHLRMALIEQTLASMDRPPTPDEITRILFGIRRSIAIRELTIIAEQMWAMPTQGSEEARIPNAMEGPGARLRVQHLSRDFRDFLLWLLGHRGITSGLYKDEVHLFTEEWFAEHLAQARREKAGAQPQRPTKRGKQKKKGKRPFTYPERETQIRAARTPDPSTPMGRAMLEDGARVRAYPYLYSFVRPLIPGEFEGHQVVSEERMSTSTHVLVNRLDPASVARTRIPIPSEKAEIYQAFGVLERAELRAVNGPFTLPSEAPRIDLVAASTGVHASFLDFPRLERSAAALEERAGRQAGLQLRIWSGIANDREMYARQFVPAFCFGYRLGDTILQEASVAGQAHLLQAVCPMPTPEALSMIQDILQNRMKEMGVDSVYELL